ncbi:MAG: cellulase family glycosylhydrolase [Anaerolinea sp.]|nr:cellulase family glycosylhydrolase [Anaerolinea sp.]
MKRRLTILVLVGGIGLLALAGAGYSLLSRGAVWQALYQITGEEQPFKQVYGFVTYLGNGLRRLPDTHDETATLHPVQNPIGVNSFLELEPELAKRERQMQMIHDAGIAWIRQKFTWQDIEISARGNFTDARNDLNGDGQIDSINAWLKYDSIVELAQKYGVQIIARLGTPPAWSQPEGQKGTFAPPEDLQDFVNYAAATATRYRGRVRHFQVWNEPNLGAEWGDQPVDPQRYTEMLCRTYRALKQIDPEIVVISGAIAPTIDISGYNLNGLVFLQRMYHAGAKDCFDILGAQGYGLFSGPTDHRMRINTVNFNYPVWLRDVMVANGDAHKPIWIGEVAWNPVPSEAEAPDIVARMVYGQVTDEQAAQYAVDAFERARQAWPWAGVICYWYFKRPDESEKNQSWYYFRMVDPDFSPRPVYYAIQSYAAQQGYR